MLYVPGLSKRLLSVRQWNTTGGDVLFDIDHCILSIMDSATNERFNMAVKPPYADSDEELHSPNANSASDAVLPTDDVFKTRDIGDAYFQVPLESFAGCPAFVDAMEQMQTKERPKPKEESPKKDKRTKVASTLLHHRMGHRSIPVLLNASKHEVWQDTRIGFEHDSFCEGCKISI